jgi:hypothetical protein
VHADLETRYLLAGIRLAPGWVFLWAFLDKLFGLGLSTAYPCRELLAERGQPHRWVLGKAATGPFTGFYHSIAGSVVVDVLFMAALLGIGIALILGIGMRIASGRRRPAARAHVDCHPAAGEQPVHGRPPDLRRRPGRLGADGRRKRLGPRTPVGVEPADATRPLAHLSPRRRARPAPLTGLRTPSHPYARPAHHHSGRARRHRVRQGE